MVGPLVQELLLVVDRITAMGAVGIEDAADAVESIRAELLGRTHSPPMNKES